MARATVLSDLGEGLYRVRMDYGRAQRDAEVARLTADIAAMTAEVSGLELTLEAFKVAEEAPAQAAADAAVAHYVTVSKALPRDDAGVKAAIESHSAAVKALFEVRARYGLLDTLINDRKMALAGLERRRAEMINAEVEEDRDVWCADYTLDAAGEVAAIAVPGEDQQVVIAPGAPAPAPQLGQLLARELQTGPQAFFNAAILPGWQRWMPTHRIGTVTAVDVVADTLDVTLDPAGSSAQGLPINDATTLADVPVQYMTCNAAAFTPGDRALVAFDGQAWDAPRVIGFADHPRPCNVVYVTADYQQVVDLPGGEQEIYLWGFVSLVDVGKQEVIDSWYISNMFAFDGVVSLSGTPYLARAGAVGGSYQVLEDATGGWPVLLPGTIASVQQTGDKLYGVAQSDDEYDPVAYKQLVEMSLAGGVVSELRRWAIGSGDARLTTISPAGGHVAAGGYFGASSGYGVRVFDVATRAKIFEASLPSIVESVDLTDRYLCVAHWGPASTVDEITLWRRTESGYVLLSSTGVGRQVYSVAVVRDYVVASDGSRGALYVWRLDHDTGALSDFVEIAPYSAQLAALPGNDLYSKFFPDGSGVSGHSVTAARRP